MSNTYGGLSVGRSAGRSVGLSVGRVTTNRGAQCEVRETEKHVGINKFKTVQRKCH
jgi:hypothetical protein